MSETGRSEACLPEGCRVYAVGDIHGRADLLRELHRLIIADARSSSAKDMLLVYLGDYLDRGTWVRETLEELIAGPPAGFRAEYLSGNHEQLLLQILDDPAMLGAWLNLGGHSTLLNYQVPAPGSGFSRRRGAEISEALRAAFPKEHLDFLRGLKPFLRVGDYFFVHAGIRPGVPLEKQAIDDLLWIRNGFLTSSAAHGVTVVHGHTIAERVQRLPNRIGIDTGAYATGILSCAVLESNRVRFLATLPPR